MEQITMFRDNEGKKLSIIEFTKLQRAHQLEMKSKINCTIDEIAEFASLACQKFFNALQLEANSYGTSSAISTDESLFDSSFMNHRFGGFDITGIGDPYNQTSYTEMSRRKNACLRIVHFLRMVDFMIIDSLMLLNHRTVTSILHKVTQLASRMHDEDENDDEEEEQENRHFVKGIISLSEIERRNERMPMFRTEVKLENQNLQIVPHRTAFYEHIEGAVNGVLDVINTERIIWRKQFEEYLDPIVSDKASDIKIGNGPNINEWITNDEEYRTIVGNILEIMNQNYEEVERYAKSFEKARDIYLQNQLMDINAIEKDDPPLVFFREEISKFKNQERFVQEMRSSKNKGVFFVDSSSLKDKFIPSPKNCLQSIHNLLPILARRKNDHLFATVRKAVQRLKSTPASVEDFASHLQFLDEVNNQMESLEGDFQVLTDMYNLVEDEEIVISPDDRDNFSSHTTSRFQELRATLELVDNSKEDRISFFSADLAQKFQNLRATVENVQEEATDTMISDVNMLHIDGPQRVTNFLISLKEKLEDVKQKSKLYAQFQEMFKTLPEDVEELADTSKDVELKLKLWTSITEWEQHISQWKTSPFADLASEDVAHEIEKYSAIGMQVQKGLPDNPVIPTLVSRVDEWKLILPIINDLKNPNLQPRHCIHLEEIIGYPITTEKDYDLNTLLELDIVQKRQRIEEISQQASNEAALEEMLRGIREHWSHTNFEIAMHKEFFVIGSVDDIVALLEDDLITVGTILSSSYVKPIQAQVQEWDRDLRLIDDTLDQWVRCQQKWIYLESVLSSPDIANSPELREDAKHFVVVDRFFKVSTSVDSDQ